MPHKQYFYDKNVYFAHGRQLIAGQLQAEIESDALINNALIRVYDDAGNNQLEIVFEGELDAAEIARLEAIVAAHSPDDHPDYFDAVVDKHGRGTHSSIADAFNSGATSVYVRDGIYIETQDIMLPDGGQLIGESQGNVKIVLVTGNSIKIDGSKGVKQEQGTICVANNSMTVTGSSTAFTKLQAGNFILLGTNFFEIRSIESDISLTLLAPYRGRALKNEPYLAQAMYTGIKVGNLVVANSSATGLYCRGIRHCSLKGIAVLYCAQNIALHDSGDLSLYEFICGFSNGIGVILDNAYSVLADTLDVYNSASHGIELRHHSRSNVFDACSSSNNNGSGIYVSGESSDLNITDSVMKHNNCMGMFTAAGSNNIIVCGCTVIHNGDVGVQFNGHSSLLSHNISNHNGCHGLVSGCDCVLASNQISYNAGHGVLCSTGIDSCIISNNRVTNNTLNGINTDSDGNVVSNNIVRKNSGAGILFTGKNNTVGNNNVSENASGGIRVQSTCCDTLFSANQVYGNSKVGAQIYAGARDTLLTNNIIKGNSGANLIDEGVGTLVQANKVV